MFFEIFLLLAGCFLILKGSEWLTDASVPLARGLNTTSVAVGLVLVSVLLSLPELLISLSALSKGHVHISVGAIFGSIIINLGLIIGLSAVVRPIKIPHHVITRDAVFMVVITLVVSLIVFGDAQFTVNNGIILLLLFIPYLVNVYEQEKALAVREREKESEMIAKTLELVGKVGNTEFVISNIYFVFFIGVVILLIGTEVFTSSLISLSRIFHVPEILIGMTLGALGPSIPNLIAAIQAMRRGYDELAVSETIGSNIFTLLITLGLLAIFSPFKVDLITKIFTTPSLIFITSLFFILAVRGRISRASGIGLIVLYFVFVSLEFYLRSFFAF